MYTTIQQQYAAAAAAAIAAANANAHHPYQQQHQSGTDNALSTGAAANATSPELVAAGKKRSAENDIFQLVFSLPHYDMILFPYYCTTYTYHGRQLVNLLLSVYNVTLSCLSECLCHPSAHPLYPPTPSRVFLVVLCVCAHVSACLCPCVCVGGL